MFKQIVPFDPKKMGTEPGLCLKNVRLGYGIPGVYASAKDAMEASKRMGTFHEDMSTVPTNCAVPIFADTSSVYEHVMVDYYGTWLSDGKQVTNPGAFKMFGWSESLNDVRVVEYVPDPAPAPAKKTNEEIADEVIAGKWGNAPERYERLRNAGYDPVAIQSIVNEKMRPTPIKVGDKVLPIKYVDYYGTPLKKTRDYYIVTQVDGNRAVLRAPEGNAVYAAMRTNNLRKV